MPSFAELARGRKQLDQTQPVLVDPLINWLAEVQEGERAIGLHPSQMYGMCLRQTVLAAFRPVVQVLDPVLRARFDIGNAVHWWYQNHYLGPMGILEGGWRCPLCSKIAYYGHMPFVEEVCPCCNKEPLSQELGYRWQYVEPEINVPELGLIGHCDGIINRGDGPWALDIKTIDPDLFRSLKEPWPSNVYQLRVYMLALSMHGIPSLDVKGNRTTPIFSSKSSSRGLLLYVDKSCRAAKRPMKEFVVEPCEAVTAEIIKAGFEYVQHVRERILPAGRCSSKEEKRAKECPFADVCFDETKWRPLLEGKEK